MGPTEEEDIECLRRMKERTRVNETLVNEGERLS